MPIWARVAVALLFLVIAASLIERIHRARRHSAERKILFELVAEALRSRDSGRPDGALVELEAALAYARQTHAPPHEMEALLRWRAELSSQDARHRLAKIEGNAVALEPERAVGEAMTLLARAETDEALTHLVPRIHRALERQKERWADFDGAEARRLIDAGDCLAALDHCLRMHETCQGLKREARRKLESEAAALAAEIIRLRGTIIEPARGRFTLGSPNSYHRVLIGPMTESLRARGFIPSPARSPWNELWATLSPFRITFEVIENQSETYLESPNRTSRLEGRMELRRGDELLWSDRLQARTEVPLPRVPAYLASRLAVSDKRSVEFERLLYESARASLDRRLGQVLLNIPTWPAGSVSNSTALLPP